MPIRQPYARVDFIPQSEIYEFGYRSRLPFLTVARKAEEHIGNDIIQCFEEFEEKKGISMKSSREGERSISKVLKGLNKSHEIFDAEFFCTIQTLYV